MAEVGRPGSGLVRAWMVGAAVYVLAAGAFSVGPIRHAMAQADGPTPVAARATAPTPAPKGPIPDAPDSLQVHRAKTVGKQALIVLAPPLLALWFGWDLWFAIQGFWSRGRKTPGEDA